LADAGPRPFARGFGRDRQDHRRGRVNNRREVSMVGQAVPGVLSLSQAMTAEALGGSSLHLVAYGGFVLLVVGMLALDLGVFHRRPHEISLREAAAWSAFWIGCGLGFGGFVYFAYAHHWLGLGVNTPMYNASGEAGASPIVVGTVGGAAALKQYLTAYVVEKSLAMDNIFVIAMIFAYFVVPRKYQHRVLFWGILGAIVMRGALIAVGAELVLRYTWILIGFGLFLIFSAVKMARATGEGDIGQNPVLKLVGRFYPVSPHYNQDRFFAVIDGVKHATPLFLALVLIEISDVIFAVDSIPAVFAITPDPFIVFTSNIMAILGLRSLFFCLAAMIAKFRYLKPALILILAYVGVKLVLMAAPPYVHVAAGWLGMEMSPLKSVKIEESISLFVVLGALCGGVLASVLLPGKPPHEPGQPQEEPPGGVNDADGDGHGAGGAS
jgi:tellurite resistance protein TerC